MKKSILFTTIPAILLGIVLGVFSAPAFSVDGDPNELGLFQLDGNPQDADPFNLSDDWETLWLDCGVDPINDTDDTWPCGFSDEFTGIVADIAGATIFEGGGSKDIENISTTEPGIKAWLWGTGSEPDKNDITNGFAAAYQLVGPRELYDPNIEWCAYVDYSDLAHPVIVEILLCTEATLRMWPQVLEPLHREDDTIIYFGADRFSNNGDAFLGFWFFQEKIELSQEKKGNSFKFSGVHQVGDILVLVDFPQGDNKKPEVKVLEWNPAEEDVAKNLKLLLTASEALCDGTGGKLACAITNKQGSPTVPAGDDDGLWPYTPKGGILNDDYPYETFYSGGINISRLIGGGRCFSSFMAESRSSRSETAQLKDFVLGSFPLCSSDAVTEIHFANHDVIPESRDVDVLSPVVGDWIHDKVTIIGEILGSGTAPDPGVDAVPPVTNVTFTLYDNLDCSPGAEDPQNAWGYANILDMSTGTLTGNSDGTSSAKSGSYQLELTEGHSYQASWAGDTNYPAGATSDCEPFYVIQPQLQIIKVVNTCLDSTYDQGEFDLLYKLDSAGSYTTAASGIGHGYNTNWIGVYPGTYLVNEAITADTAPPDLDEYVTRFPSGESHCNSSGEVTLAGDDTKTCVIENVRKPHLIIKKVTVPATDLGKFNLQVNGVTVYFDGVPYVPANTSYVSGGGLDVGDGEWVRIRVDTIVTDPAFFGSFTVGETAGTGTNLVDYQTTILCDDEVPQTEATFGTDGGITRATAAIPLTAGEVVTCTITNIRKVDAGACPIQ